MMSGFSLFSWDIYSLFRRQPVCRQDHEDGETPASKGAIHFFGMFPVL